MNTAGGPVHPDERWPGFPLAIPRGPREQFWHVGVALCVLLVVALPQLHVLAPVWVLGLVLARYALGWSPPAWLLQRLTLLLATSAGVFLTGRLGLDASRELLVALVRDNTPAILELLPDRSEQGALVLLLHALAGFVVATLVRFDLRAVRRDIVDERVWARQQTRRRQVMAAHHRRQPPPEIA
jgi:hypothetical protein